MALSSGSFPYASPNAWCTQLQYSALYCLGDARSIACLLRLISSEISSTGTFDTDLVVPGPKILLLSIFCACSVLSILSDDGHT